MTQDWSDGFRAGLEKGIEIAERREMRYYEAFQPKGHYERVYGEQFAWGDGPAIADEIRAALPPAPSTTAPPAPVTRDGTGTENAAEDGEYHAHHPRISSPQEFVCDVGSACIEEQNQWRNNAALIAAARNALPALLAKARKADDLRRERDEAREDATNWEACERQLVKQCEREFDRADALAAQLADTSERLRKAEERSAELADRVKYALGALRVIAAKDCDLATARGFAKAGIDFLERGEAGCAELRAARLAPAPNGEKGEP